MNWPKTLDEVPTGGRNQACVRSCLDRHATCAGRSSFAMDAGQQNDALRACKTNYIACVRTC